MKFVLESAHTAITRNTIALLILVIAGYQFSAIAAQAIELHDKQLTYAYRFTVVTISIATLIIASKSRRITWPKDLNFILIFAILYLIRLAFDAFIANNHLALTAASMFILTVMLPISALAFGTQQEVSDAGVRRALLAVGYPAIAIALTLILFNSATIVAGRAAFFALNSISLAQFAGIMILTSFVALTRSRLDLKAAALAALMSISTAVLLYANSRGPSISLLIAITFLISLRFRSIVYLTPMLITVVIWNLIRPIKPVLLPSGHTESTNLFERIMGSILSLDEAATGSAEAAAAAIANGGDESTFQRWAALQDGIDAFMRSPIFGAYFQSPGAESGMYPHNIVVETGMALGLVGLIAIGAVAFFTLRAAFRIRKSHPLLVALLLQAMALSMLSGAIWGAAGLFALSTAVVITSHFVVTRANSDEPSPENHTSLV